MTEKSNIQYVALCYESWGRADHRVDALINMIESNSGTFDSNKDSISVMVVEGSDLGIRRGLNGVSVSATKKLSETEFQMSTEALNNIRRKLVDAEMQAEQMFEDSEESDNIEVTEYDN